MAKTVFGRARPNRREDVLAHAEKHVCVIWSQNSHVVLNNLKITKAAFAEPMLLLPFETLPEGQDWLYELKLDGYRAQAIKADSVVQLRSRNNNDFTMKYPGVAESAQGST